MILLSAAIFLRQKTNLRANRSEAMRWWIDGERGQVAIAKMLL